jgi:peptidylprolyl isomerase
VGAVVLCSVASAGCMGDDPGSEMLDPVPEVDSNNLEAPADVAAPPADAVETSSGLVSKLLLEGQGERFPSATDTVRVHYTGWQTNGVRFDSSIPKGMPLEFALMGVIAGWTEGLQLMVEGERRRFWIPEDLAYAGRAGYPMGTLVFDVELIAILTP